VQLPVYNEPRVIERLITAVCNLQYPRELLEIQVLDDSTDSTTDSITSSIVENTGKGFLIRHIRRVDRRGFKAGALEQGLLSARGEFIAIFDADFIPEPLFLMKVLPYFQDEKIGMAQSSWSHINRNATFLTIAQALLIEGHCAIDQAVRFASGRFLQFSGTSGVWRKRCVAQSGGFHSDTLAEDLDLSYRAQLAGWKFVFLSEALSQAELPIHMNDYKKQQQRWAMGTMQVAQLFLRKVMQSSYSLKIKIEALFHLTSYLVFPLSLLMCLLLWPALLMRFRTPWQGSIFVDISLFAVLTLSVFIYHLCSQFALGRRNILKIVLFVPVLMAVSIGVSLSNTLALIGLLFRRRPIFNRTSKTGCGAAVGRGIVLRNPLPFIEILLSVYFIFLFRYSLNNGLFYTLIFLPLFILGFLYTGIFSVFDFKEVPG